MINIANLNAEKPFVIYDIPSYEEALKIKKIFNLSNHLYESHKKRCVYYIRIDNDNWGYSSYNNDFFKYFNTLRGRLDKNKYTYYPYSFIYTDTTLYIKKHTIKLLG